MIVSFQQFSFGNPVPIKQDHVYICTGECGAWNLNVTENMALRVQDLAGCSCMIRHTEKKV